MFNSLKILLANAKGYRNWSLQPTTEYLDDKFYADLEVQSYVVSPKTYSPSSWSPYVSFSVTHNSHPPPDGVLHISYCLQI